MAEGLREVADLPDPVGEVTGMWRRQAGLAGCDQILLVGGQNLLGGFDQGIGHAPQQIVLYRRGEAGQYLPRRPGILRHFRHLFN
jgi:hypothetical protein